MTLPDERTRAVVQTRQFLRRLMRSSETPRVPSAIREEARRLLRHFPWEMYLDQSAQVLPDVWGPTEEDANGKD